MQTKTHYNIHTTFLESSQFVEHPTQNGSNTVLIAIEKEHIPDNKSRFK